MRENSNITQEGVAAYFLAVLVAVLFVLSFASAPLAQGSMMGDRSSLKGEIVAIDNVHNAQTMTLRSQYVGQFPNDTLNIFLHKDTKLKICDASKPLKDLSVDRNANVTYHEVGGVAVADSISEQC